MFADPRAAAYSLAVVVVPQLQQAKSRDHPCGRSRLINRCPSWDGCGLGLTAHSFPAGERKVFVYLLLQGKCVALISVLAYEQHAKQGDDHGVGVRTLIRTTATIPTVRWSCCGGSNDEEDVCLV